MRSSAPHSKELAATCGGGGSAARRNVLGAADDGAHERDPEQARGDPGGVVDGEGEKPDAGPSLSNPGLGLGHRRGGHAKAAPPPVPPEDRKSTLRNSSPTIAHQMPYSGYKK